MTIQGQIAQLLKPWLDSDTWYKSNHQDEQRFYRAVKAVNDKVGTDWSEHEFQDAVYSVIGERGKEAFQEHVRNFRDIANHLREYAKLA